MNKIMKIIMISRLSYAAEKHELLSRSQFEDRQRIFIEHALHFITKRIHTAWINDEIAIMLLLNVTEVYDNVCHLRLFHNLKKKRIENNSLKWIISFLSKKYIILKFVNYITNRIRIKIELSQDFLISSIFYLFYNVELLETCIDENFKTATSDFVNDVAIMTIDSTETDNLEALRKSHEKTIKWTKTHESIFAPTKYQLIHFRKNILVSLELSLRLTNHFVNFEEKCKYLKIIMNSRLQWQNHLQYLEKQSANKLAILSAFAGFIWDIETKNLKRTYLVIVLSQFIYCASIWYVFTEKHDFKQKEEKTIKFLTDIQTRTAQIIAEAFKFISETALKIEFHLLSIRQQLDVFIYDALLRIIISFIYEHIRSQRKFSDRAWMLETTQHQRTLYAQLNSLHKLEIRYVTIFKKNIINFENRIPFSALFWWQSSKIIIVSIVEKVVKNHDHIMKDDYSAIFTNDSDIKNKIKIFAITIFISIKKETSIMMKKKQAYVEFFTEKTVYFEKFIELKLTLNIADAQQFSIVIFIDSQTAIKAIRFSRQQFDQFILQRIITKLKHLKTLNKTVHIHWISAHIEVSENETVDQAVKEVIEWRSNEREFLALTPVDQKILTATIKAKIRDKVKAKWKEIWTKNEHERIIYKIVKKSIKNVLRKFKHMTRLESSVIIQVRTEKIELRNYLHRIEVEESSQCSCEYRRQTILHTLLKCLKFDELREEMWKNKREMNLTKMLNTFALIYRAFKFLLSTNELYQFRYFTKAQENDETYEMTSKKDAW